MSSLPLSLKPFINSLMFKTMILFIAFGNVLMEAYPSSVQELDAPVLQKGRIEFAGDF